MGKFLLFTSLCFALAGCARPLPNPNPGEPATPAPPVASLSADSPASLAQSVSATGDDRSLLGTIKAGQQITFVSPVPLPFSRNALGFDGYTKKISGATIIFQSGKPYTAADLDSAASGTSGKPIQLNDLIADSCFVIFKSAWVRNAPASAPAQVVDRTLSGGAIVDMVFADTSWAQPIDGSDKFKTYTSVNVVFRDETGKPSLIRCTKYRDDLRKDELWHGDIQLRDIKRHLGTDLSF